jgi:hypothetical protein
MNHEGYNTAEEAIQARIDADDVDEFEGMNCNDYLDDDRMECLGWDGVSRRCYCGNRRVSWETGQYSNGKFYAYGVAY